MASTNNGFKANQYTSGGGGGAYGNSYSKPQDDTYGNGHGNGNTKRNGTTGIQAQNRINPQQQQSSNNIFGGGPSQTYNAYGNGNGGRGNTAN